VQSHLVIAWVDLDEELALLDLVIVIDQHIADGIGKFRADRDDVTFGEGIVGRFVVERVDQDADSPDRGHQDNQAEPDPDRHRPAR